MISTEALRIRKAWDGIAVNFDRYVTPTANWDLAKTTLHFAGLKSGMNFLDVASGSGALSLPAARLGAKVLAVDISPVMIERLKARADEERLVHLKGRVMDGHHLDLDDNTFDMAGSQFGVVLFSDIQQGVNEMVRVIRPGGTVFLVASASLQMVESLDLLIGAVKQVIPHLSVFLSDSPPLTFQGPDKGVIQQKMEAAGLRNVRVKPVVQKLAFHSGREMWNWVTSSDPIVTQMIPGLEAGQKDQVVNILEQKIRELSFRHEPAILEVAVNIGIGEKIK